MPNNQNFLIVMWNEAPWLIPLLALSWAGMIALTIRVRNTGDRSPDSIRWKQFRLFLMIGAMLGASSSLLFLGDPAILIYVVAFTYCGVLIGSYFGLLHTDPLGAAYGIVVALAFSIAYFLLHWTVARGRGGAGADMLPLLFSSFAVVVSALLGAKSRFRLSLTHRPFWYYADSDLESTESY